MPGFVIHIAVAKEYLKKHNNNEYDDEFIKGNILPDLTDDKTKTHYGKSPTYTNLKEFLLHNKLNNSLNKGIFLHLITDYLFYNYYLENVPRKSSKEILHNDYDIINKDLIEKYDIKLPENIEKYVFYKNGESKILTFNLAVKVIKEISELNIEKVQEEVIEDKERWKKYKTI